MESWWQKGLMFISFLRFFFEGCILKSKKIII
nr:MAG TPA: hypothetical protein [Caudoviricetes sp.]